MTRLPPPVSADEVIGKLRRNQVVILTGVRGTAKHAICEEVVRRHTPDYACHQLDASSVRSLAEMNAWLCAALGLPSNEMPSPTDLPELDRPALFVIRRLDRLHAQPWLDAWQDTWRALFGATETRGTLTLLLMGRPLLRAALGGRGSPLLNVSASSRVAPLEPEQLEESGYASGVVARAVCRRTGGHPQATLELIDRVGDDVGRVGETISDYIRDRYRFLCGLIDDHGEAGRQTLADLARVGGEKAAEVVLQRRRASDGGLRGTESLDDLVSSGLLARDHSGCAYIRATMLDAPSVKEYLTSNLSARTPALRQPDDHALAARLIYEFENVLRGRVDELMSTVGDTWWTSRIQDQQAVADAELRRNAERDSVVAPEQELGLLAYLDFRQLAGIIQQKENWNEFFALGLHLKRDSLSAADFTAAIDDIALVRNKVAHSRPVTTRDVERLRRAGRVLGFPMN
jgi:Swt1-like HEPN